jgi:glycerol-3-phosphate dehydrogenase
MEKTRVVIVGGGATGAGILWDLTLRGVPAVLLEKRDLANGATGRCHGLLHSGARYAVKDPDAASECIRENQILRKVARACVHETGGLFVHLPQDDASFIPQWVEGCAKAGIDTTRLSRDDALALEPNLPHDTVQAYTCPDAHVDVFQLVLANVESAVARGGIFKTYAEVTGIQRQNGRVTGVQYRDCLSGEQQSIACEIVINAGGGWAQAIASMAGVDVPVRCDRGALLIMNQRLVNRVVNRCRKPGDADILVPAGPVCILGTSSVTVPGPENLVVPPDEVRRLLALGSELVPALAEARVLRIFTGARPLYAPKSTGAVGGREISRGFQLLDHEETDNVAGFISIVGGKLTTYRLMAQVTADLVCKKLGIQAHCLTDQVPLRDFPDDAALRDALRVLPRAVAEKAHRRMGTNLAKLVAAIRANPSLAEVVCECELVTRGEIEYVLKESPVPAQTIEDIGRRTRMGFGTCQGTFCGYRAMLVGYGDGKWSADEAAAHLHRYLQERWKGESWIPEGKQAEQLNLSRELFSVAYSLQDEGAGHHVGE